MCKEEDKDMAVTESVKVNVQDSLIESLREVEKIRSGELPKRSYKNMIDRVKQKLNEEQ